MLTKQVLNWGQIWPSESAQGGVGGVRGRSGAVNEVFVLSSEKHKFKRRSSLSKSVRPLRRKAVPFEILDFNR